MTHTQEEIDVQLIARAAEKCGFSEEEVTLDRAYGWSGFDPQVAGAIIVERPTDMLRIIAALAEVDGVKAQKLASCARQDSLGERTVFYFPGIVFAGPLTRYDEKEGDW